MLMKRILMGMATWLAAFTPAAADDVKNPVATVQNLREACAYVNAVGTRSEDEETRGIACMAFVIGVVKGVERSAELVKRTPPFCLPGNTAAAQWAQAFMLWASRHPEYWQEEPTIYIMLALRETWPCDEDR